MILRKKKEQNIEAVFNSRPTDNFKCQLKCFIIGEATLPISCAEILLERDHQILGIVTSEPGIIQWGKQNNISIIHPQEDYLSVLKEHQFDYLFSIFNDLILSDEVLKLPQKLAINYHDGPLPRYAGPNATSWALINRETFHGVTWHMMTNVADAGDILEQKLVDIDSEEIAFTLNGKCYEAAIQSFQALVEQLETGKENYIEQDLQKRIYYLRSQRPKNGAVISWHDSAAEISALVRGLDCGPYPNKLVSPKMLVGKKFWIIVSKLQVTSKHSNLSPGTITEIGSDYLQIATATQDIRITELLSQNRQRIAIANLVEKIGLTIGSHLGELEASVCNRINSVIKTTAKQEPFWLKKLAELKPLVIPHMSLNSKNIQDKRYKTLEMPIAQDIPTTLHCLDISLSQGDVVTALLIAFLARISRTSVFDIGFSYAQLRQRLEGIDELFSPWLPCRIQIDFEESSESAILNLLKQLNSVKSRQTFLHDIVARYPRLQSTIGQGELNLPIQIVQIDNSDQKVQNPYGALVIAVTEDGRYCRWLYDEDSLSEDSVVSIAQQLTNFLHGTIDSAQRSVSTQPLLSKQELHKILREWNDTQVDYQISCIHELINSQVEKSPDSVAVIFEGNSLTFQELNNRANQLAHFLQKMGVGPEVLVGIYGERSLELVVGLLAVLKAGGAYLPLDPNYPEERIAFMLEDAQVPVILTQSRLVDFLPQHKAKIVLLDADWEIIAQESSENPTTEVDVQNLVYVIYTSGSTGKPKGVMNTHRGLCNRLLWMQKAYQLQADDRVLQKTPFSFDVSVWEFFWPLMTGARLIVAKPEGHKDSKYLTQLIAQEEITTLHFVPSMLRLFLQEKNLSSSCRSLHRVICSGEALAFELQEEFFRLIDCELYNLYGPTEAAIDVTFWKCLSNSQYSFVPIGRPIANTQIYLLDEHLQPVPIGIPGELHIGGMNVARGYLNRRELTDTKFIPDPFSKLPDRKLYKTGDLARFLADGNIEYLGRIDFQVKIRGLRIELGEIEAKLNEHPAVHDAVVLAREDIPGNQQLVAYIVPDNPDNKVKSSSHSLDSNQVKSLQPSLVNESELSNFNDQTFEAELNTEHISKWREVYEKLYSSNTMDTQDSFAEETIGWNSSYTRLPIATEEMNEWLDSTVSRIQSLKPNRLFEIGCGTGMLLSRIAPQCSRYLGTDFSTEVINRLAEQVGKKLPQVELFSRPADNFNGINVGDFDTIILNSVIQYFPSINYLFDVLTKAINILEPNGGRIFIGDVLSLALLEAFHASVELFHNSNVNLTKEQFIKNLQQRLLQEEELVVDPSFFQYLKGVFSSITHVQINIKRGSFENEMTCFRYDVVIYVNANNIAKKTFSWIDWQEANLDLEKLQRMLVEADTEILAVRNIPNARVFHLTKFLEQMRSEDHLENIFELYNSILKNIDDRTIEPEKIWSLEKEVPYDVDIEWSNDPGFINAIFRHKTLNKLVVPHEDLYETKSWEDFSNNPLERKAKLSLVSQLRNFLSEQLPDYMIPSKFLLLDEFPLNPNGKLDRKALPVPDSEKRDLEKPLIPPSNELELRLTQLWEEVLNQKPIGVSDNFFDLGGHSLLAIQLFSKLEEEFDVQLPLANLFESPTIKEMASRLNLLLEEKSLTHDSLVQIRAGGSKSPLFLIHDADGEILLYYNLARYIDSQRPIYGLRPLSRDSYLQLHTRIKDMAAYYIECIQRVQPKGPYLLGGLCAGGILAVEMAIQLQAQGQDVALVAIIDAADIKEPLNRKTKQKRLNRLVDVVKVDGQKGAPYPFLNVISRLGKKLKGFTAYQLEINVKKLINSFKLLLLRYYLDRGYTLPPYLENISPRFIFNFDAKKYSPGIYHGKFVLFRATEAMVFDDPKIDDTPTMKLTEDPLFGWEKRTTVGVDVFVIPGGHSSMLQEPYVRKLAEKMQSQIDNAGI